MCYCYHVHDVCMLVPVCGYGWAFASLMEACDSWQDPCSHTSACAHGRMHHTSTGECSKDIGARFKDLPVAPCSIWLLPGRLLLSSIWAFTCLALVQIRSGHTLQNGAGVWLLPPHYALRQLCGRDQGCPAFHMDHSHSLQAPSAPSAPSEEEDAFAALSRRLENLRSK